jgi:hypothetical protein
VVDRGVGQADLYYREEERSKVCDVWKLQEFTMLAFLFEKVSDY